MKHFSIWQWVDFVRDLGEEDVRAAMATHLASRCSRCEGIVNVLRHVAVTARAEVGYDPPPQAIRLAKAIYSLQQPEKTSFPRLIARLVHDSMRAPLPAGMRAESRLSRHVLFEAGNYYLDLQLERQPASGLVTLIGQLANRTRTEPSAAEMPVWLKEKKRLVATTLCNRFGEFQLEYAPARNLQLHVPLFAASKRLEVSLNSLNPTPLSRPRSAKLTRRKATKKGLQKP
jgi:hypothetical protein